MQKALGCTMQAFNETDFGVNAKESQQRKITSQYRSFAGDLQ
jgi:hypothetical protein